MAIAIDYYILAGDRGHTHSVRFVYQSTLPEHTPPGSEVDYVAYLKSAYQQMDTEAIATLRQLAEAGELD